MRTRIIAVAVAAVLAIGGATALVFAVQGASQSAAAGENLETVLVVAAEIPAGASSESVAALLEQRRIPAAYVPDGAVSDISALDGLVATTALHAGEHVLASRWSTPAALAAAGGRVEAPDGSQEISLALALERVVGGAITPGSRVGVWASEGGVTSLVFDQVLVTALASTVAPEEQAASTNGTVLVTFAVTAGQAQGMIAAAEFGKVWLSLQESR